MKSHVLVTGGAGFIGSHLVDALISKGAKVTVMDIDDKRAKNLPKEVDFVKGDVTNPENWKFNNVDVVYHLAAAANQNTCEKQPEVSFLTNVQGTFNALEFARRERIKKLIYPSSAQLYGRYPKYFPTDEKHPIDVNQNVYSMTKSIGEMLCIQYIDTYKVPLVYFRFFNVFGPRQKTEYFIPTIITEGITNEVVELWTGKPTRDFIYVTDVADALVAAMETSYCGGPINIGTGVEIKTGDAVKKIASMVDTKIRFLNKDIIGSMRMCCDNEKAKRILKWKPKVNFDEGIKRTVEWYKENYQK